MLKYSYVSVGFIAALILCLVPMPRGYISLMHWVAMFIFGWIAYQNYYKKKKGMTLLYIFLFILYLPFEPINLAKELWNVVYIITVSFLSWNLYRDFKQKEALYESLGIKDTEPVEKKGKHPVKKWLFLFVVEEIIVIEIGIVLLRPEKKTELKVNDCVANNVLKIAPESSRTLTVRTISEYCVNWTNTSGDDSLGVFAIDGKRGYFNIYTKRVVIEPKYNKAWVFSEGLAGVELDGYIGFINGEGKVVIDFKYPYRGNSCVDFVFHDGHCVVADTYGKCGVINKTGMWIIKPAYDHIHFTSEYAVVSMRDGKQMQIDYSGNIINEHVVDSVKELCFTANAKNNDSNEVDFSKIPTGYYVYKTYGRAGLMDGNGHRLTEPIYSNITAINATLFLGTLLDGESNVLIDEKGNVIQ